jgi:hypothetical protein
LQGTPQQDIFKVLRVSDNLGHKPTSSANELWHPAFGSLSQGNGPPATLLRRSARYGGALQFKLTDILIGVHLSSGTDIETENRSPTAHCYGRAITRGVAYCGFVPEQGDRY